MCIRVSANLVPRILLFDYRQQLKDKGPHKKGTGHTFISFKKKGSEIWTPLVIGRSPLVAPVISCFNIKQVRTFVLFSLQKQNKLTIMLLPSLLASVTIPAKREITTSSRSSPKTCITVIYMKGLGVDWCKQPHCWPSGSITISCKKIWRAGSSMSKLYRGTFYLLWK